MKTKRVMAGWYLIQHDGQTYKVYRYDNGLWGVYSVPDDACLWVDSRLKDCKAWIAGTHTEV